MVTFDVKELDKRLYVKPSIAESLRNERRSTVFTGSLSHLKIKTKEGEPKFDFSHLKSVDRLPRQVQVVNLFDYDKMLDE